MILGCFGPGSISRSRGSDFLLGDRVWFGWLRPQMADEPFVSGDDGAPGDRGGRVLTLIALGQRPDRPSLRY